MQCLVPYKLAEMVHKALFSNRICAVGGRSGTNAFKGLCKSCQILNLSFTTSWNRNHLRLQKRSSVICWWTIGINCNMVIVKILRNRKKGKKREN